MTLSIQTKVLAMCILLILLTTLVISGTYYLLTKQDKQRASRERIQIALDIVLEDFHERVEMYTTRFTEFLQQNHSLLWGLYSYTLEQKKYNLEWATIRFLFTSFQEVSNDLKAFGRAALADRVMLYDAANRQLLVVYQRMGGEEIIGSYLPSEDEGDRYLPMQDIAVQTEITFRGNNADLQYKSQPLPQVPPPEGVNLHYKDDIPDTLEIAPFSTGQTLGIRIAAPIFRREEKLGVLVGEVIYTQSMVEGYAALSRTEVNLFAGPRFSVGTLPAQQQFEPDALARMASCADIRQQTATVPISISRLAGQPYYQGQCAFKAGGEAVGALSVNLSQAIEQAENRRVLTAILLVSGIVIALALGLSLAFSRHTITAIYNIVHVIGAAAEGDLRHTARVATGDEIGSLAEKLNQMISQLRGISEQVQRASDTVHATADTILRQIESLTQYLEQQSGSVDNTTVSVEKIKEFIDAVAVNTSNLLSAAEQILASIQESRASIAEVTTSTDALTTNLHLISQSVEQVNQAVKQITGHSEHLEEVAQQTETELHQIDHSLQEVSNNANHTQQLAKETMDAATSGQSSVEASIQGMTELKDVMTNTAQIIREVNDWGAQVSSILDIVDEITEQTSLLALNASIISAQAGAHGRGFAVVADEIKNLATRTKASTTKISTLVHELQRKTTDGVQHTAEGLRRTEQGLQLATTVQEALSTILERATHSSTRAADTARVIQQTVSSSQAINTQMTSVTEMVSKIRAAIQHQRDDVEQVVAAVENLSGMSEQVNRASVEQKRAAEEIERSMSDVTRQFSEISGQTETLQQDADQVVNAMHTIETATAQSLDTTNTLSGQTVKNLVQQSNLLQKIVKVFKVN